MRFPCWWYAGPVIWLLFYAFAPAAGSLEARVAVVSSIGAFYSFAGALLLLNPAARTRAAKILSAAFAAHGCFNTLRMLMVGMPGALSDQRLMTGFVFTMIMVQAVLIIGGTTYLIIAMVRGRQEASLRRMSETDFLTGIDNRRAFTAKATALLDNADAGEVALLLFDLDRFKRINDEHGHGCGDEVIKLFADSTADHLRPSDVFARLGGEEFAAVVKRRDRHEPAVIAQAIVRGFANQARMVGGRSIAATVSAGVATNAETHDLNGLLTAADRALYRAKSMGRDRVEDAVAEGLSQTRKTEAAFRQAS
ncbi:GGDEF domain-containing protein [Aurantimonas sp. A2-1-M11]|uniref:GGDEF domain-containing protein n=1 Tax=Aurantimonas sp. A2-1-M11 TaxID=3113712 RepID=UPI002F93708D